MLRKWREVVKDSVLPDSFTGLVHCGPSGAAAVRAATNAHYDAPRTQRERKRQVSRDEGPGRRPVTGGKGGDAGECGKWEDE